MLVKEAKLIANISTGNSKMIGSTYAQDSFACVTGSKLAEIENSVCKGCYARRIQKMRPSVDAGWKSNLEKFRNSLLSQWVESCAFQIDRIANRTGIFYHRWFDSGDLDGIRQLVGINRVALATPNVSHWLPTRELGILLQYSRKGYTIADNLTVRVSSPMVNDKPLSWSNTSTVHNKALDKPYGMVCPAPTQGNNCGDCRACFDKSVDNVSYKKH